MAFKVTFETEVGAFDSRMSRSGALAWLKSRRFGGMVSGSVSGPFTPMDALAADDLARALAVATRDLVDEIAGRDKSLTIRNEPDDEKASWVTVRATSIHAVVVRVVGSKRQRKRRQVTGDTGHDGPHGHGFPFSESDREWLREQLDDFDSGR